MAKDTENQLKDMAKEFEYFSLDCDETTDITNTAQFAIFMCGITAKFQTKEEFLSL